MSDDRLNPERSHLIGVLRGKIAHKTGEERGKALQAYRDAKYGKGRTQNLPITSRLRCHCATRALLYNLSIIETNDIKSSRCAYSYRFAHQPALDKVG